MPAAPSDAPVPFDRDTAVEATRAYVDESARDRLVLTGADAATYLQSQLSQEVRDLAVGAARWTFVLDPTGKVEVLARLHRTAEDAFEMDTDAGFGHVLETRLRRFMIRVDLTTELHAAAAAEPGADTETRRVRAGWPRMGAEIIPGETIPATTGVVEVAVDFAKGCYPGQELVERMDSRGAEAPKRPRVLDVLADAAVGDAVVVDDVEVGVITSVAPGGEVAIASVKRGIDVGVAPAHLTS